MSEQDILNQYYCWQPIPNLPPYEASTTGEIRNSITGKLIICDKLTNQVDLSLNQIVFNTDEVKNTSPFIMLSRFK